MKPHIAMVLAKLGVRDRVQAVVHAYEKGPRAGFGQINVIHWPYCTFAEKDKSSEAALNTTARLFARTPKESR